MFDRARLRFARDLLCLENGHRKLSQMSHSLSQWRLGFAPQVLSSKSKKSDLEIKQVILDSCGFRSPCLEAHTCPLIEFAAKQWSTR